MYLIPYIEILVQPRQPNMAANDFVVHWICHIGALSPKSNPVHNLNLVLNQKVSIDLLKCFSSGESLNYAKLRISAYYNLSIAV